MRDHQVVDWYSKLAPDVRVLRLREMVDTGDLDSLLAVMGAPAIMNLVPSEMRAVIERQMLQQRDPAKAAQLTELRQAVGVAQGAVERLRSYVRTDAGMAEDNRARLVSDAQ